MISVQIFQTSAGTTAKSHTCATDATRGRLLGYLLLLGTQEAAVKVTPIPGPPDAFRGGGEALAFEVPMLLRQQHGNYEYGKKLVYRNKFCARPLFGKQPVCGFLFFSCAY